MNAVSRTALEELSQAAIFQKVAEICAAVNAVISATELLEISLKKTMELFDASRGSIFIVKDNRQDLELRASQGMAQDEGKSFVKRMGQGIMGQVAESKKPVIVDDIASDQRFQKFKSRDNYQTASFICAPLMIKDQLIGVINITDKQSGVRFKENEMQMLDFLASQIALNYRRVELYYKFKNIIKETQNLRDKLGRTGLEKEHLKKQIFIQEKLATIGKLAGGIAHEFNNPLDGVMRYTNLCLEHIKDDEVVRGYLLEIKHGLNRMASIVKNLLACSRDDIPNSQRVSFRQALDNVLVGKQNLIDQKNIHVERDVAEGMPDIIDFGLERILSNLLHNAIDALKDNGKITVKAGVDKDCLVFSVSDTGSGIEHDKMDKIFEPFFTTKDIDKGCGLGLTIVGEIIKSYDGKIDVESQVGEGTSFTIRLPLERSI